MVSGGHWSLRAIGKKTSKFLWLMGLLRHLSIGLLTHVASSILLDVGAGLITLQGGLCHLPSFMNSSTPHIPRSFLVALCWYRLSAWPFIVANSRTSISAKEYGFIVCCAD